MTHNATVSNALLSKNEGMKTCHPNIHVTVYFVSYYVQERKDDRRPEMRSQKKGGCNPALLHSNMHVLLEMLLVKIIRISPLFIPMTCAWSTCCANT